MQSDDVATWVQKASAGELAAFMGLAGARLVILLGSGAEGAALRKASGGRLVSVEEAARMMDVSVRWVYDNRSSLPFVRKLCRSVRVDVAALESWLEGRR